MKKSLLFLFISTITLFFNLNVKAQCNFINGNFETWQIDAIPTSFGDTIYYENPTGWVSFADQFGALFSSAASFVPKVNKTIDKNSGTYAVRLDANDNESSDLESYGFCNTRPDKLTGFFKFNGSANDTFLVNVYMINEDPTNFLFAGDTSTAIGHGSFLFTGNQTAYQQFSTTIYYKSTAPADTFVIQVANINSNVASPMTSAYLDDLNLFLSNDVDEFKNSISLNLYPNPNNGDFIISLDEIMESPGRVEILNSLGQVIFNKDFKTNRLIINLDQPCGIYFARITTAKGSVTKQIIIKK